MVRPALEEKARAHAWSLGASNGEHAVRLDGLEEGATRLLACPALHPAPPPGADAPSAAEAAAAARSGSADAASALAAATVWLRCLGLRGQGFRCCFAAQANGSGQRSMALSQLDVCQATRSLASLALLHNSFCTNIFSAH